MTENTTPHGNAPEAYSDTTVSGRHRRDKSVQRRRVLIGGGTIAVTGGLAAAGLAAAEPSTRKKQTKASTSATSSVCVLNAEVTEGPYSLEGALVREDIREDK